MLGGNTWAPRFRREDPIGGFLHGDGVFVVDDVDADALEAGTRIIESGPQISPGQCVNAAALGTPQVREEAIA